MLSDNAVLRIEEASFAEQRCGFSILPKKVGFAGLLHQFTDSVLPGDIDRHGVIAIGRIELRGPFKLLLGANQVVVFKQASTSKVGIFSLVELILVWSGPCSGLRSRGRRSLRYRVSGKPGKDDTGNCASDNGSKPGLDEMGHYC